MSEGKREGARPPAIQQTCGVQNEAGVELKAVFGTCAGGGRVSGAAFCEEGTV